MEQYIIKGGNPLAGEVESWPERSRSVVQKMQHLGFLQLQL